MTTIPIKTTGYGITRLEELIFDVTDPTDQYASPFELYNSEILPDTGTTLDGDIRLRHGRWKHEDDNSYISPGTILYVSSEHEYETDYKRKSKLCQKITGIVARLIQCSGLTCPDEMTLYKAVFVNLKPFKAIKEYHIDL